ncbi:hypothetical protein Q7P37_001984 [Cladosporium fusiforme]
MPSHWKDNVPNRLKPRDQAIDFSAELDIITIVVGSLPTTFRVDARLLANSKYFQAALKKEWAEGQERTITISDIEAKSFNAYLNWGHSHYVFSSDRWGWTFVLRCYRLGDRLMDTDFKDAILDACCIRVYYQKRTFQPIKVTAKALKRLYNDTLPEDGMRRFLVDTFGDQECPGVVSEQQPRLFLKEVCEALAADPVFVEEEMAACKYHDHEEGKCYHLAAKGARQISYDSLSESTSKHSAIMLSNNTADHSSVVRSQPCSHTSKQPTDHYPASTLHFSFRNPPASTQIGHTTTVDGKWKPQLSRDVVAFT